ncbi:MAG: FecR family protein [Dysgonomonas sp.]
MEPDKSSYVNIPDEALLLKYIIGDITDSERLLVETWAKENEENEDILTQIARLYYAQKTQQRLENRDTESAFRQVKVRLKKRVRYLFFKKVAVAVSLIIGLFGIGSFIFQKMGSQEVFIPSMITVHSNDNSRTQLVLPDGTEVYLNSRSSLTYPSHYLGAERKVILSGEAYFKVVHNAEQPFIVSTLGEKYNVKVLGTEFNMRAYSEDEIIQTTLVSGSVQIDVTSKSIKTVLLPSQKAVYSVSANQLEVVAANTDRETDWLYNRLVFKNTPMSEVLTSLARFYNIEFDVKNNIINTYTFTGTFQDKPLYQVLDYMKISSKINYTVTYQKDNTGTKSVVILK